MDRSPANKTLQLQVTEEGADQRLDKFLSLEEDIRSRSRAEHLIDSGLVTVNGREAKASLRLRLGDQVQVQIPLQSDPTELEAFDLPLKVVFEDPSLLVINKPAGLVVHPAAGHAADTLVNALVAHSADFRLAFNSQRPGIVHRLDKDTSGLLVVAKTDVAMQALTQQFKNREVHRRYEAAVKLGPLPPQGTLQSYLGRHPSDRKRFASQRDERGRILREYRGERETSKWAVTHHRTLHRTAQGLALLELRLETGRTHQIRVHLSEVGTPILGDPIYGKNVVKLAPRLALHAKELGFRHPITQEILSFSAPWPDDLAPTLKDLELL